MIKYLIFIIFCIFLNISYYLLLRNYKYEEKKGVGFFISLIPIFVYLNLDIENIYINYQVLICILLFSFIYLYDDLVQLGVFSRIFIQFFSGTILLLLNIINLDLSIQLILLIIIFGFWNIFLTNAINFNDGNDGNLGFLILSYSLCFLFYNFNNNFYIELNLFIILFIVIFLFFNFYFSKFYFGDAGCLAVTLLLNQMMIEEIIIHKNYNYLIFLFPLIYIFIDVFYVIFYRIYNSENLFNRNYYHLYQKINLKFKNYYYLIPNIIFPFLIIFLNKFLLVYFNLSIVYLAIVNTLIIFLIYFVIKYTLKL